MVLFKFDTSVQHKYSTIMGTGIVHAVFWSSVNCCGELGSKMDVGLGVEVDVEGEGFVGRGHIPSHWSCLSIRSASPVIISIMVLVSCNSGKSLMSSYAVRSLMTGKSSRGL